MSDEEQVEPYGRTPRLSGEPSTREEWIADARRRVEAPHGRRRWPHEAALLDALDECRRDRDG